MADPIDAVLVGAGNRGHFVYGAYALRHPDEVRFVAVAEPDEGRRRRFADAHAIPPERQYASWEEVARQPRLAPALVNATMDGDHYASGVALAGGRLPPDAGEADGDHRRALRRAGAGRRAMRPGAPDRPRPALRAVLPGRLRDRAVRAPGRDRLGRLAREPGLLALRAQLRSRALGEQRARRADDPGEVLPRSRPADLDPRAALPADLLVRLVDPLPPGPGRRRRPGALHRRLLPGRGVRVRRHRACTWSRSSGSSRSRRSRSIAVRSAIRQRPGDRPVRAVRLPLRQRRGGPPGGRDGAGGRTRPSA